MSALKDLGKFGDEAFYFAMHNALRLAPTEACSDVGARLSGSVGRRSHPVADARCRTLLARLRPDWAETPEGLEAAVARAWENIGRCYAEYSVLARIVREGRVTEAEPGLLTELTAAGARRTIWCFLHLGNWEVVAHRLAHLTGGRGIGIGDPPPSPVRAGIFRRWHDTLPGITRSTGPGVWREVVRYLNKPDGAVLINIDEPTAASVGAPFFGRPPRTDGNISKVVRMAAAAGARLVPVYAERLPGVRFVIHALPPVEIDPAARGPGAVALAETLRVDAMIAPVIRRFADQWHMASYFGKDVEQVRPQGPLDAARRPV